MQKLWSRNQIYQVEVIILKEEVRLETLRQTKWNLDEYFEDLTRETNIAKNEDKA